MVGYRTEMDFCEVEWRRQKTFHGFENKPSPKPPNTATPVVEIRPFTQKEWFRGSSLPNAYGTLFESNRSEDNITVERSPPPKVALPPKSKPQVHVINLTDQILPRVNRIHPQIDHRSHIKQRHNGFVSLGERTKTTLEDIRSGNSSNKPYSCLKQALTPRDVAKIQGIRLNGAKMRKDISKRRLQYLDPWSKYENRRSGGLVFANPQNELFGEDFSAHSYERQSMVYDNFDLAGSLPSLHICHSSAKTVKPRRSEKGKPRSGFRRIGGIKNSFQIMNESGPPANIERQLTMELEIHLEKMRRQKDNAYNICTMTPRKYQQVTYRGGPTSGELHLQRGLSLNSKRCLKDTEESEGKANPASRPTTEAKTECRDSGIQSPAETDDDSVSLPKDNFENNENENSKECEEKISSPNAAEQVCAEAGEKLERGNLTPMGRSRSAGARPRGVENPNLHVGAQEEDSAKGSVLSKSGIVSQENGVLPRPMFHLPEINPSAVPLV